MPPVALAIARTFCFAIVLLASACNSDAPLSAPADELTADRAQPDASSRIKRDAGRARGDKAEGADAAVEVDDTSESAADSTDAFASEAQDAGADDDASAEIDADSGDGTDETEGTVSCDKLTYDSFGRAFMEAYCVECHNSSGSTSMLGGLALDTLPLVVKNKTYLKKVVVPRPDGRSPPMPKGGNPLLTDAERTKFGAWIDCGPN